MSRIRHIIVRLTARLLLLASPLGALACAGGGGSSGGAQDGELTVAASIANVTSSASGGTGSAPTTGNITGDGGSSGPPGAGGVISAGTGMTTLGDTGDGPANVCSEIAEIAEKQQPADILFVIDNSGSMKVEAASVKDNMNEFSASIIDSGVDVHVVLISSRNGKTGMCIDPPLGGGGCPADDSKLPVFLHIDQDVGSHDALQQLLDAHADWQAQMRPNARKHVVVVSDDDSDLDAKSFEAAFKALDPSYKSYRFHAIVGEHDPGDDKWCAKEPECCALTVAAGEVYLDLIDKTDGVHGDLCKQDFKPVFDTLSAEVIQGSGLACAWAIPESPADDAVIDLDNVDVDFDDGMGVVLAIAEVPTLAACAEATDGWYYDNPGLPTQLLLCPKTCAKIQLAPKGSMSIKFACKPLVPQ